MRAVEKFGLVALLACCSVSYGAPGAGNVLLGPGAVSCKIFIAHSRTTDTQDPVRTLAFAWAQGWFSARNYVGREDSPLTVGGTLSADTLESFLIDQCKIDSNMPLALAADGLYEKLAKKGL
jgi:hypothetical protein